MSKKCFSALSLLLLSAIPSAIHAVPWKVFEEPQWELTIEAMMVEREGVKKNIIADDFTLARSCDCFPGTVLTATTLKNHFRWEPGLRAALDYTPSQERSIEFSLEWVNDWIGEKTVTGDQSLYYPFDPLPDGSPYTEDYNTASIVSAKYKSHIWDAEANYWAHYTHRAADYFSLSAIIGLRGIYLAEHFHMDYTNPGFTIFTTEGEFTSETSTSAYWTMTKNRMLGIQGGGNLQTNPSRRWSFEITGKAAILENWGWMQSSLHDENNTVLLRHFEKDKGWLAYLLDGELQLFWHHINKSIYAGYRLIGIWNVALAPSQLSHGSGSYSGDEVGQGSRVYYHIVAFGFNFLF